MKQTRYLSPEIVNEYRGCDIYQRLVKTRIRDFDHLLEYLHERFPALAQFKPLIPEACEKIAKAIRLDTGLTVLQVESALADHFMSIKYIDSCFLPDANYHDPITGEPVLPLPESDRQATIKRRLKEMGR